MFTATPFAVITCALLTLTVEGWFLSRTVSHYRHVNVNTNEGYNSFVFKRDGIPTDQEIEMVKEECLSVDMDPALGITENDVITAFRKTDVDGNGALLNAELGNFTSVLEIYEACETVNNIV